MLKRLIDQKKDEVEKVHPGLTCFKEGVRCIPVEAIPGIRETGWRPAVRNTRVSRLQVECADPDSLHKALRNVINAVSIYHLQTSIRIENCYSVCYNTNKKLASLVSFFSHRNAQPRCYSWNQHCHILQTNEILCSTEPLPCNCFYVSEMNETKEFKQTSNILL